MDKKNRCNASRVEEKLLAVHIKMLKNGSIYRRTFLTSLLFLRTSVETSLGKMSCVSVGGVANHSSHLKKFVSDSEVELWPDSGEKTIDY